MQLKKYVQANASESFQNIVAGAWKFRDKPLPFGTSTDELVETAIELVNARIGTGKFIHVFVRGTGKKEIGICFMYELCDDEIKKHREALRRPYEDFFRRRHGAAFRGWDIGTGVDIINLI